MRNLICIAGLSFAGLVLVGCASKAAPDASAMAPPPVNVVEEPDLNIVKVDHP